MAINSNGNGSDEANKPVWFAREKSRRKKTNQSLTIRIRLQQSASEQMKQEQDGNIVRATMENGRSVFPRPQ